MDAESGSLHEHQLARLRRLIGALREGNPFYRPRLEAAGLDDDCASLDAFAAQMPFTTKAELQADQLAEPPYGTNLTYPPSSYTRFSQTSGTSGVAPMVWLDTPEGWEWMLGNWRRVYQAAGLHPGDSVYFAFSFGPFLGFWTAFEAAASAGYRCIPGGGLSTVDRLRAILRHEVDAVCCTPTYALRLAEVAGEEGIDLHEGSLVSKIIVAGEPGGSVPAVRERLENLWLAEVFDHHGMTEVGPVSYQAPGSPGDLLLIEESYFAEVIDPEDGSPASPGEVGELVLTTLGREGSPLLRYRTGDLVRPRRVGPAPGAPPGPRLLLQGGILGRADDMVVVRGVNLYPSAVDEVVRTCPGVTEYRVEVDRSDALAQIALRAEVAEGHDPDKTAAELAAALKAAFALRIPVTPLPPGALPRFEMKARRWEEK